MSWTTPITDRTQQDIIDRTTKGFFNVADWLRIKGNIDYVKSQLDSNGYLDIPLNPLTTPTTTTIPVVSQIDDFIENIARLAQSAVIPSLVDLKYDYQGGANEEVPDYNDVNDWENNLLRMHDDIPKAVNYRTFCGVSKCGQARLWQNRFRRNYVVY